MQGIARAIVAAASSGRGFEWALTLSIGPIIIAALICMFYPFGAGSPTSHSLHSNEIQLGALIWRYQGAEDTGCEGLSSKPLVDAVTAVAGEKLVLLEGPKNECTHLVTLV
ncbi:hypothetical protein [Teredinibacter turnerae]|uniref:hypothetical protein n=1 Tax=Teredinibacter turnerae TaxID=2426 RepID=UPI000414A038|nr:hypothetical protein [Teredinibacter turnerae]